MSSLQQKLKRWKYVRLVSKATGESMAVSREKMRNARREYGISYQRYYERKFYKLTEERLKKKFSDMNVRVIAQILGISLDEAKRKMDIVKKKYGISYRQYANERLYVYKSREKLEARLERMKQREEQAIYNVCEDTGWSYEEAKKKMDEVKEKYKFTYRQYNAHRMSGKTEEEIAALKQRHRDNAIADREFVMRESGWDEEKTREHMRRIAVQFSIPTMDYIMYKAWELNDDEIQKYARMKDSERLWAKYNLKEEARVLAAKDKFDVMYKDYLQRKFWINKDTNYEAFVEFAHDLDYIFCKPILYGGGLGTEKHKVDPDNLRELYDLLMSKDRLLVEECVKQHSEIEEFMPGCVNTIRVVTLQDDQGEIHILCVSMKFGNNTIVDNPSKGGVVAGVDENTGIINTDAVDTRGNVYSHHPTTGKKFKGFQIPNWDMVVKLAKDAITVQDGVNYVGWDLAVCQDKAVIIEGNSMPDLVLNQAPYVPERRGIKYIFEPYLSKERTKK